MKKTAWLIFLLLIFFSSGFFVKKTINAFDLIRPIAENNSDLSYPGNLQNDNNNQSIFTSFGEILGVSNKATQSATQDNQKSIVQQNMEMIKMFLDRMSREANETLDEFYAKNLIPTPTPIYQTSAQLLETDQPLPTIVPALSDLIDNNSNEYLDKNTDQGILGAYENNQKKAYTIALLGDSMIDTLGSDLPHLRNLLNQQYPAVKFTLLNYGQGSTDMDSGLYRLTNQTTYLDRTYPALLSYQPDILVVESFAYNHWGGQSYDLDRQWLTIAKIIDTAKEQSPQTKIILAATIAPNSDTFGDGKLNWPKNLKWDSAIITKAYLQNLINFANSEHYPLADAYHPSLDINGNGREAFINQSDHLHPSEAGAALFSQKIVDTIKINNLIN